MGYTVEHFTTFQFKETGDGYFALVTEGGEQTSWTSKVCVELTDIFNKHGELSLYNDVLPTFDEVDMLDEEDLADIRKQILSPQQCLEKIASSQTMKELPERLATHMQSVIDKWKAGYSVIMTY